MRDGWESEQRSSPKCTATPDNPSVSLRLTAPFTQGSLGDGGCGLPRRFAPRNDNGFLSFRGGPTGRRGNPSFLRWTGVRAAVPRAWPPPTKFRAEIWGIGQVVGPYGKPNQPPKPAGTQRSARASGREGWAGIGAKTIPKGGPPPRLPGQRLAKRKARKEQLVKFSLCPMTEGCSTAQKVRKSQQSPARAHVEAALTEQNGLAPHPAARQGASRARNCAAKSFFLLAAPPPFSFCRLQKENGGWIAAGHHLPPRPIRGSWVPSGP